MKSYRKELSYETKKRSEILCITEDVRNCVKESGISEGLLFAGSEATTAGVFVNTFEPGLCHDFEMVLEKIVPEKPYDMYWHNGVEEENADAHIKREFVGRGATCAVTAGELDLAKAEDVLFFDLDGGKPKKVLIKIIGE